MANWHLRKISFFTRSFAPTMILLMVICVLANTSAAQGYQVMFKALKVLQLRNGPNELDLNGDGLKDLVFIARRENFNAHGFDIVTLYIYTKSMKYFKNSTSSAGEWHLVPFFNEKGVPDELSYTTTEGADCCLSDIRILRPKSSEKKSVQVVVGIRDFGESYADDAFVKFISYDLKTNKDGMPGEPLFYFQQTKTIPVQKKYCDINQAFQKELGLGSYRSDQPQEWRR